MTKQILTKGKFKKWLESKPSRARVGGKDFCPIAGYLGDSWNVPPSEVTADPYAYGAATHGLKQPPLWAALFMNEVDNLPQHWKQVTAAKALEILEQI